MLLERYRPAYIDAVDIAAGMVAFGRRAFHATPGVTWMEGDARTFKGRTPYPLIASCAALHWVPDLAAVFKNVYRNLAGGGWFVLGLMLQHTLKELQAVRRAIAPAKMPRYRLPTLSQTVEALAQAGLEVHQTIHREITFRYPDARALLTMLHEQGVTGGRAHDGYIPLTRGEVGQLVRCYDRKYQRSNSVYATYEWAAMNCLKR